MTALLLLLAPATAEAAPATAEEALAVYRQTFEPAKANGCPRAPQGDEIVVCGRRSEGPDPNRLPLPVEPEPGEPTRMVLGEAPRATVPNCTYACPPPFGITLTLRPGTRPKAKGIGE